MARACWQIHRLSKSISPIDDIEICHLRDAIGQALGLRRLPRIFSSPHAVTPVAVGILRPMIILPERLIGEISEDEMRDVLLHEVAHVNRRDTLFVLVQELARSALLADCVCP